MDYHDLPMVGDFDMHIYMYRSALLSLAFEISIAHTMYMTNSVMTCMSIAQNGLQSCTQMTLDIRLLKNIFLLHTKCKHMTLAISMLDNIDN